MTLSLSVRRLLESVRIYCDDGARARDAFGRLVDGNELTPIHDHLYQLAIDLKLVQSLVFKDRWKSIPELSRSCTVAVVQPRWWPANSTNRSRKNLLQLVIRPRHAAPFGSTWTEIRRHFEVNSKTPKVWSDDPALVFAPSQGVQFCRTACVGHEGLVYYFAYGSRELAWERSIVESGFELLGKGERAYRLLVPEPGKVGG